MSRGGCALQLGALLALLQLGAVVEVPMLCPLVHTNVLSCHMISSCSEDYSFIALWFKRRRAAQRTGDRRKFEMLEEMHAVRLDTDFVLDNAEKTRYVLYRCPSHAQLMSIPYEYHGFN